VSHATPALEGGGYQLKRRGSPHPQLDGKYLSADALGKVDLSPGPDGELVVCPFDFNSATGESKMRAFPIAELEVYSTLGVSVKNGSAELVTVLDPEPDESPEVDVQLRQSFVLAEGGSPQTMDLSAEGINWRMFHEGGNWTLKGDDGSLVFTEVHPPVKIVMERVNAGMVFRGRAIR